MTIKQLYYFLAVAQTKSFTGAAKQYYVAQTAMSQQIGALEKELGVKLFQRNNRRVQLTEAGASFYRDLAPLIGKLESAVRRASEADSNAARQFSLGLYDGCSRDFLIPLLRAFSETQPKLSLNLTTDEPFELLGAIQTGDMDAAFLPQEHAQLCSGLRAETVTRCPSAPFAVVVHRGHPFYEQKSITWTALAGQQVILLRQPQDTQQFKILECRLREAGVDLRPRHAAASLRDAMTLVSADYGVAVLPAFDCWGLPGAVRCIPILPEGVWTEIVLVSREKDASDELRGLRTLCANLPELPPDAAPGPSASSAE